MPKPSLYSLIWSQAGQAYELHTDGILQQQFGPEDEQSWWHWLLTQTGFSFQGREGHLNVLKEARPRGAGYWYAYAYTRQRKVKCYLGKTSTVTLARLEEVASLLARESARPPQPTEPLSEQIYASSASFAFPVTLLLPKLSSPCLPVILIARERLLTRLDMALTHPLTLLSASAGFGKTTLLSTWATHRSHGSHSVAWLSLEEQDNDPMRFWVYVLAALHTCEPSLGETALAILQTPHPPVITTVLTALINDLVACPEEVVLVLDDFQVIDDPAITHAFQFLLAHLPPKFHLVLATRVDPPFALSRLRAQGRVIEIRDRDLCFTREEAASFLTQAMGQPLAEEEVRLLEQRTEGWIAGLQLAVLAMRERADHFTFVQRLSGSQRFILEYVQEEILERQPKALQHFLLQTAVLTHLNASLCQAVTGEQASQQMLETLERRNLFLTPLDEEHQWYRFHSLFRDVLQARLHILSPELIPGLHQRAAYWYDQHENAPEAIVHALAGADYDFAATLMERSAKHMWLHGEARMLHTWLKQLPDALLLAHARLALTTALYFLHQIQFMPTAQRAEVLEQIEQTVARLERTLRRQEDVASLPEGEKSFLHNRLHVLRECITGREAYVQGDMEQMRLIAYHMLDLTGEEDVVWKMLPTFNLVMSCELQGDFVSLVPMLSELKCLAEQGQHHYEMIRVMNWLSRAYLAAGQLRQAYQICVQAVELLKGKGGPRSVNGFLHLNLAILYWMWDQREEAQTSLHTVIHIAQTWQHMDLLMWGYHSLVPILLATEKQTEAEQALEEMERLARQYQWEIYRPWVMATRVHYWLTQGNLATAADWTTHLAVNPQELVYANEAEYMVLARVYLALQRHPEVLHLLASLRTRAQRDQRRWDEVHILALQVATLEASGEVVQAKQFARRLLQLTESEGYIRVYLDAGPCMQRVLQSFLDTPQPHDLCFSGISLSYVATLLTAFEQQTSQTAEVVPTTSSLHGPLTAREREVLHLLAQGATNQGVAEQLVIQLSTAKKHVANILRKLGAANRTQAIAHAREYALL